ncbi:MAG: GNAT family N-acetyltransferase [Erysipelotrichaceae bacterium]|nr:GNAT family N-acetyltransferase [Erysipelotrichaceae bacterium]
MNDNQIKTCDEVTVCGRNYRIVRLLGHGKGGYSYLAECDSLFYVLKQIHHEPCDYYVFGDKFEAECRDYLRLKDAGIRMPEMIASDKESERIVKEYTEGESVFDLLKNNKTIEAYLPQVYEMAARAEEHGLNIDYFPTNFIIREGELWYVDYECNKYMEEWNFVNWGSRYWKRTPEFEAYLKEHDKQICFEAAAETDASVISGLRRVVWSTTYRNIYPDDVIDHYDYPSHIRKDRERIHNKNYHVYLIKEGDLPIGYFYFEHTSGLHIQSLYVLKEYQKNGIGKKVFSFLRQYCEKNGLDHFTWECNQHNYNARAFYEHMGGINIKENVGHENKRDDQITYSFKI